MNMRWLLIAVLFVVWIVLQWLIHPARAHDWYPAVCCSQKDCQPIPESRVRVTPEGYQVEGLEGTVPTLQANTSPDGQYHVCHQSFYGGEKVPDTIRAAPSAHELLNRSRWCLWVPEGGV